jgi:voltage-gated potassium channel
MASEENPAHSTTIDRRALIDAGIRMVLALIAVLGGYWLVPLDWFDGYGAQLFLLLVGLVVYLVIVARRMIRLTRASNPMIQLGEAVVVVVVVLVCLFAFIYAVIANNDVEAFNEPLDKHAALYFSMTVTTTTGFRWLPSCAAEVTPRMAAASTINVMNICAVTMSRA